MNIRRSIELVLVSAAAVCCAFPAAAQFVTFEETGSIQAFHGGAWRGGGSAELGQQVTVDFSYDSSTVVPSFSNGFFVLSAPISGASIVGGALGTGIDLEPDGPGSGTAAEKLNLSTGESTGTAVTSAHAPSRDFSGTVFAFSYFSNGVSATLDLIQNVFSDGRLDRPDSGSVRLSNVVSGGRAPEIDPASALSALTLLAGSLAVIRGGQLRKIHSA
ncbi:MAG: hypothetical protein M3O41_15650 [Pseudomonadota bacterium]|nr:hypothetical protein [Pseudomonadota bacterium]